MQVGELEIIDEGRWVPIEGQTAKRAASAGKAYCVEIRGPGYRLDVADCLWQNADRDVRVLSRLDSPEPFDRLVHGMRVSVERQRADTWAMRLRIPAIGTRAWPTLHQTNLDELDEACGLDVRDVLVSAGALNVGTRREVLGDDGRTANELCVVFDDSGGDSMVPLVAYGLTPITVFARRFA